MTFPQRVDEYYTYADLITWDDDVRYELIDGVPILMAPPSITHQRISGKLYLQIASFLKGRPCEVFHAPVGVRLNADLADDTVVQPDIVVVCDRSILDDKSIKGAPDMVIEILSPSTASRDKVMKFNQYLRAGVREYWIVHPDSKTVSVHVLKDGEYITRAYADTDAVSVHVLEGCTINLSDVFEDPLSLL